MAADGTPRVIAAQLNCTQVIELELQSQEGSAAGCKVLGIRSELVEDACSVCYAVGLFPTSYTAT